MADAKTKERARKGSEKIQVVITDHTRLGTELLVATLRTCSELEPMACESTAAQFVETLKNHKPDVVVIGTDGKSERAPVFEMVRVSRSVLPSVPTIVLLESSNNRLAVAAFRAGARGVCSYDGSVDELQRCIQTVFSGEIWMSAAHLRHVVEALVELDMATMKCAGPVDTSGFTKMTSLTNRERELVRAVADGLSNREIATRLQLSVRTVKNYLLRVFDKLNVSNRTELAVYATQHSPSAAQGFGLETASSPERYLPQ